MKTILLLISALSISTPAMADIAIKNGWVRGTVEGQSTSGAYMTITSSEDATLVEARSPVAGAVEIHTTTMEGNVMKMRPLPKLDLPKGKAVELKPGGNHIMLMNLKKNLGKGERVPITLVVEGKDKQRKTVDVMAEIKPLGAKDPEHKHDHEHTHDHKH